MEQWVQKAYTSSEETPFLTLASHAIGPGKLLEAVIRWHSEGPSVSVLEPEPLAGAAIEGFLNQIDQLIADGVLEVDITADPR